MKFLSILLAVSAIAMSSACAQETKGLTEEAVKQFCQDLSQASKKPAQEYTDFIAKTTHPDFQGTMNMNIHMPGKEAAASPEPLKLTRDGVVNTSKAAHTSLKDATVEIKVREVLISPDKKSARVKSDVIVTNQEVPAGEPIQVFRGDSKAACTDEMVYTPEAGIQILKTECMTDLVLIPPAEAESEEESEAKPEPHPEQE